MSEKRYNTKLQFETNPIHGKMSVNAVDRVILQLDQSSDSEDLAGWLNAINLKDTVDVEVNTVTGNAEDRPTLVWIEGNVAYRFDNRPSAAFFLSRIVMPSHNQ